MRTHSSMNEDTYCIDDFFVFISPRFQLRSRKQHFSSLYLLIYLMGKNTQRGREHTPKNNIQEKDSTYGVGAGSEIAASPVCVCVCVCMCVCVYVCMCVCVCVNYRNTVICRHTRARARRPCFS